MNKESFAAFLPRFETLSANAGWSKYSEDHKISLFKNALNRNIKSRLLGSDPIRTWSSFISKLHNISSDLIALSQPQYFDQANSSKRQDESSEMDWEPSKSVNVSNLGAKMMKRATWVTKDILEQRREKGVCVRCGHKGHRSPKCNFLPPLKPKITSLNQTQLNKDNDDEDWDWELTKPEGVNSEKRKEKLL